jgi:arginine deiminase
MMISDKHLIVGVSERSTSNAANEIIHKIFSNEKIGIEKISIVSIPPERSHMHIDTIFTQVSRAHWVMYGYFSDKLRLNEQSKRKDYSAHITQNEKKSVATIYQYYKPLKTKYQASGQGIKSTQLSGGLEALLYQISTEDFKVPKKDVRIVYSGNNIFPHDEREQWTDSCNVVALKESVVIGYDRNEKTMKAFEEVLGYKTIHVKDLLQQFDNGVDPQSIKNTLIVLSSHELSRARGGSHCMSMPLLRETIQ